MGAWHFWRGAWVDGNPGIMGPLTHGAWMASTVFDGARAFEGRAPDLDRHCRRLIASAHTMDLQPVVTAEEILELAYHGIRRFAPGSELYIRPMFWAESGFVAPEPESTQFCLTLQETPIPQPSGMSVCLSRYRRPTPETAPTEAKASCLYPTSGQALREARKRGFDNAVMLDAMGNVAELSTANIWLVKDGVAITPAPNGTFLNGITKQRVAHLLREAGVQVEERRVTFADLLDADEAFSTGNYGKVMPIVKIEDREMQRGPVYEKARAFYWDWAANTPAV